ncbi:hypothetical protein [Natronolimnohabitans innermongolicus]|uniref:Lipoprotein n=1 Tax=Natronolimnohabitans innermongolicus JCM 12255 TaxID=1227499 RepID=L9X2L7_9EURY|nr:hypothetical protein [Natronolimnohabitans innermongolicus]ELY54838.1 hypothetical protein C493_12077 [Natronolimnohabitans innermongolicus JCM 12255]
MNDGRTTRRRFVAGVGASVAAVTAAGCLGSDDDDDDPDGIGPKDIESRRERMPDPDVDLEWDDAREFRAWLFDDGNETTGQYNYTEDLPPVDDVESPILEVIDGYPDRVDGLLRQPGSEVVFGEFDRDDLESTLEGSDAYAVTDEYEGYVVAEPDDENGDGGPVAGGDDAIVVGSRYERPIDAGRGERDRLEEIDPWMTHVFETLPTGELASGAYLAPLEGLEHGEIYCWGVSTPDREADASEWALVFDDPDDAVDAENDVRSEVELVGGEVTALEVDERTMTMTVAGRQLDEEY